MQVQLLPTVSNTRTACCTRPTCMAQKVVRSSALAGIIGGSGAASRSSSRGSSCRPKAASSTPRLTAATNSSASKVKPLLAGWMLQGDTKASFRTPRGGQCCCRRCDGDNQSWVPAERAGSSHSCPRRAMYAGQAVGRQWPRGRTKHAPKPCSMPRHPSCPSSVPRSHVGIIKQVAKFGVRHGQWLARDGACGTGCNHLGHLRWWCQGSVWSCGCGVAGSTREWQATGSSAVDGKPCFEQRRHSGCRSAALHGGVLTLKPWIPACMRRHAAVRTDSAGAS